jgi:hypothetical protein
VVKREKEIVRERVKEIQNKRERERERGYVIERRR